MPIKHLEEYRDPEISRFIIDNINKISRKKTRLMEVYGTHTMSIFKSGIRDIQHETISLLSGPGCPVCVTAQHEIDAFIALSRINAVMVLGREKSLDLVDRLDNVECMIVVEKKDGTLTDYLSKGFKASIQTDKS